jgi:hypothetical protein
MFNQTVWTLSTHRKLLLLRRVVNFAVFTFLRKTFYHILPFSLIESPGFGSTVTGEETPFNYSQVKHILFWVLKYQKMKKSEKDCRHHGNKGFETGLCIPRKLTPLLLPLSPPSRSPPPRPPPSTPSSFRLRLRLPPPITNSSPRILLDYDAQGPDLGWFLHLFLLVSR